MPVADAEHARALDDRALRRIARRLAAAEAPPWLHREVARRMAERLPLIRRSPQRIVEWGGFLGASANLLSEAFPKALRTVVEPDTALLARSRKDARSRWWSLRNRLDRPSAVVADSETVPGPADLVWSNMLLHALPDPPALFARWEELLAPEGFLMFSCLGPGTLVELHRCYAAAGFGVPAAALVDMHDLGDMLVRSGFADPVMDQETLTLRWDHAEAALAELRGLGGNASPDRVAGLRTPRWRARLVEAMRAAVDDGGRIALRFEIVYGHAFKGAPRVRSGETAVSLDAMRRMVRGGGRALR